MGLQLLKFGQNLTIFYTFFVSGVLPECVTHVWGWGQWVTCEVIESPSSQGTRVSFLGLSAWPYGWKLLPYMPLTGLMCLLEPVHCHSGFSGWQSTALLSLTLTVEYLPAA